MNEAKFTHVAILSLLWERTLVAVTKISSLTLLFCSK